MEVVDADDGSIDDDDDDGKFAWIYLSVHTC